MPKVMIDIDDISLDKLMVSELQKTRQYFIRDLESRRAGKGDAFFHLDPSLDIIEIQSHIDAVNLLIAYYGGDEGPAI